MQNKPTKKERVIIELSYKPFLLLSFLLHVIVLIALLTNGYFSKNNNAALLKNSSLLDVSLPASLKPKKSDLGTFVFFDAPPQPQAIPHQLPEIPKSGDNGEDDADEEPSEEQIQAEVQPQEKVLHAERQSKKEAVKIAEVEKTAEVEKIALEKPINEEKRLQRIQDIEAKQATIASLQHREISAGDESEGILKPRKKAPKKEKMRKKSIIAMTKGFIENFKDEGDDWLERKGDDNKRPSFEELKFISYEEKINWQLQSSWKRNHAHNQRNILEGKAVVDFIIDEYGKLVSVHLLQSSGNKELDHLIIQNMHQASPFPPLPKHFNMKTYASGRVIHVFAHKFGF